MNPFERGSTKHFIKPFRFFCYASALVSLLLLFVSPVKLVTVKESSIQPKSTKMQRNFLRSFCLFWFRSLLSVYKISRVFRRKHRVEHTHSFCHACSDKIPTCCQNTSQTCQNKFSAYFRSTCARPCLTRLTW